MLFHVNPIHSEKMETTDFFKTLNKFKMMATLAIALSSLLTLVFAFLFILEKNVKEGKTYVATDAGTFLIKRNELNLRQNWEVKNHAKLLLEHLFENDSYTYIPNLESALHLMDNAIGMKTRDMLGKSGLYDLLRKENAYTRIYFDSVVVREMVQPYEVRAWFKQAVMWRGMNQLVPYGVLLIVSEDSRSEQNPFGLLVNQFDLIKYTPEISDKIKSQPDSLKGERR
jgi:hypothetical protein